MEQAPLLRSRPGGGRWFEAGPPRSAVPFGFEICPNDEFGIYGHELVALHESVEDRVTRIYAGVRW